MNKKPDLEFPKWEESGPTAPPMTAEQYDQFLVETISMDTASSKGRYTPVAAEFKLMNDTAPSEGQTDER
ncbi:MAG: hypothetical protein RBS84_08490 [Kiritimatiellia bacterium]|jgi:hypothetical protein|nr:hypothetical protein [Kiritimatiellia bacterium]